MASRRNPSPRRSRRPRPAPPVERHVLALARELAGIAATPDPPPARRDRALACLAAAFGEGGQLAALLPGAWNRAREDPALALALAWAREQVRSALQEIVEAGVRAGTVRKEPPAAALAWVLLAACESLMREAPGGGVVSTTDVLDALARLTEA